MVSMILLLALAADDPPPLRLMTGTVVEVDGFTFTVANAKTRKTFRLNADTMIIYDGVRAKTREDVELRVKDKATVTYDFESGDPKKVQVTPDKRPAPKKTEESTAAQEEEANKAERDARRAQRDKEREVQAIEEEKQRDEEIAKAKDATYRVRELGGGALGFGPFRTRFCEMAVKAKKRDDGRIDLTVTIIDPDEKPRSFPEPKMSRPPGGKPSKRAPAGMKNRSGVPVGSIWAPPDPESLPTGWLWLTPRLQVDGVVTQVKSGGGQTQEIRPLEIPRSGLKAGAKGKEGPDDPKEIPQIAEQLEKQITGDAPGMNGNKKTSTFSISVKFIVPASAAVKPEVGAEMRFDQWIFRFNDENNPKVLDAFNQIFERLRQE